MSRTILRNAVLFYGRGNAGVPGEVLIEDGRIAAVGRLDHAGEAETIDCMGQAVTPGFIDLHSHSDLQVLDGRREKSAQGVTTEVVGNCGFSPYPCGQHAADLREFANGIFCGGAEWRFEGARDYLESVDRQSDQVGVFSLVGHGSLRVALFGNRQGALEARELDLLEGTLDDALAAGACGFSTGLMYAPGSSAPFDELERLCRVVARRDKLYATHMRSYSFGLIESIDEQLELARRTGCRLQISHLQTVGPKNWDRQRTALDRIERAREEGIDVEFDIYPYQAGSTVLTQFFPQRLLDGGTPAMLARLRHRDERRRLCEEAVSQMAQRWSDVFIVSVESEANQEVVGLNLEEIGRRRAVDPVEAAADLLIEEAGAVNIVSFNQSEDNLRQLLTHPLCSVISDGFYVKGRPHPRLYGTFPFLMGTVVRERQWMSLPEAVHKVTAKPAARLGAGNLGSLTVGARADLTIFDPAAVAGPATYEAPEQNPVGITATYRAGRRVAR